MIPCIQLKKISHEKLLAMPEQQKRALCNSCNALTTCDFGFTVIAGSNSKKITKDVKKKNPQNLFKTATESHDIIDFQNREKAEEEQEPHYNLLKSASQCHDFTEFHKRTERSR